MIRNRNRLQVQELVLVQSIRNRHRQRCHELSRTSPILRHHHKVKQELQEQSIRNRRLEQVQSNRSQLQLQVQEPEPSNRNRLQEQSIRSQLQVQEPEPSIRNRQLEQEHHNRIRHRQGCQGRHELSRTSRIHRHHHKVRQEQSIRNRLQEQIRNRTVMQLDRSPCSHRMSACRCRRIRSQRSCQLFYPSVRHRRIRSLALLEPGTMSIPLGQASYPKGRNRSWCRS